MTVAEAPNDTTALIGGYAFSLLHYRCITPLHIGCGQDVGVVDLPVIRERTTGYPIAPGSGIRGSFRDVAERRDPAMAPRLFGSEDAEQAGCVIITDAKLLLFPIRSHPDIFHWITCPFALKRYADDVEFFTATRPQIDQVAGLTEDNYGGPRDSNPLVLEEFPFGPRVQAWKLSLPIDGVDPSRVVLLHDEVFSYFARNATIVTQHNHLSAAKTVLAGQLFSVEAVPSEAVFYGFVGSTAERTEQKGLDMTTVSSQLRKVLTGEASGQRTAVMLGGDEGTGLGLTRVIWS